MTPSSSKALCGAAVRPTPSSHLLITWHRLKEGVFTRFGEPTEAALKVLAEKLGAPGVVADNDAEAVDAVTR